MPDAKPQKQIFNFNFCLDEDTFIGDLNYYCISDPRMGLRQMEVI